MFDKSALPVAVASACAVVFGLVLYEKAAPLADKPSIRLRAMTGDVPTRDLTGALAQAHATIEASKANQARLQAIKQQRAQLAAAQLDYLKKLEQRIDQKKVSEWADSPAAALPALN